MAKIPQSFSTWLSKHLAAQVTTAANTTNNVTVTTCVNHGIVGCPSCAPSYAAGGATGIAGGAGGTQGIGGAGGNWPILQGISSQISGSYPTMTSSVIGTLLTPSEQSELAQLEEQNSLETKMLQRVQFKELHPELRQMIVALLTWNDKSTEIGAITAPAPQRLTELRTKQYGAPITTMLGGSGSILGGSSSQAWLSNYTNFLMGKPHPLPFSPSLPYGLTAQDLHEAHIEATIEEELLSAESEHDKKM